jgi:TM2 domain-containing membrane protein YozV
VKPFSLFLLLFFATGIISAATFSSPSFPIKPDSTKKDSAFSPLKRDTANTTISSTEIDKKRFVAAVLAFPLPFGFLGLHRIYLGSAPYIPVVYLLTLGGGFGLLPLIDFLEIVFSSDEEFKEFQNNPKIFMWE